MDNDNKKTAKRYLPLITLVVIAALAAAALTSSIENRVFSSGLHFFMGLTLCQFAMLKLFHLSGFVEGFRKYDLAAKKFSAYAYLYPFIELGLGLTYLSLSYLIIAYIITIAIMSLGTVGVIRALMQKLDLRCACMGTVLNVPLSTVTLSEDIVMGLMAFGMLLSTIR